MISFSIEKEKLSKIVSHLSAIVESRVVDDIDSCLRIEASGSVLKLTATCNEITIVGKAEASIEEDGIIAISAKVFADIVRRVPANVILNCVLSNLTTLKISAGCSNFSLSVVTFSDFPIIEHTKSVGKVSIQSKELHRLMEKSKICMSTDEARYTLNGVAIDFKNGSNISCSATDGYRLAVVASSKICDFDALSIVPRKSVLEVLRFLSVISEQEDVEIDVSPRTIRFESSSYVLISKLVDGAFPNYKSVIPSTRSTFFDCSTRVFTEALERVSAIIYEKRMKIVKFSVSELGFMLYSSVSAYGSASEKIDVNYGGNDLEINFNVKYFTDALGKIDGDFKCFCGGTDGAVLIQGYEPNSRDLDNSVSYVIMPVR